MIVKVAVLRRVGWWCEGDKHAQRNTDTSAIHRSLCSCVSRCPLNTRHARGTAPPDRLLAGRQAMLGTLDAFIVRKLFGQDNQKLQRIIFAHTDDIKDLYKRRLKEKETGKKKKGTQKSFAAGEGLGEVKLTVGLPSPSKRIV